MIAFNLCACFKVLLPKCSQKSIVLSGLVIIRDTNVSCCFFFFPLSFGSYKCTWFSVLLPAFVFFPLGQFLGISREWKKPLWPSWNAWKPYHLFTEDEERIPRLCTCPCLLSFPPATCPLCTFLATQANSTLAPWPKGRWLDLLGPWCAAWEEVLSLGK